MIFWVCVAQTVDDTKPLQEQKKIYRFGVADSFMTIADFTDYARAQREVSAAYLDADRFTDMSLVNIAKAGIFSADRAVKQYADEIWKL